MADGVEMETVDGTVKSVVFRNDETGFTILHVTPAETDGAFRLAAREITVLGTCAAAWEGEELHATGEWVDDPVRGRQFKAKSVECIPPKSVEGVRRYLASGLIRGIGPVLANRIVDRFGAETIDVLDHHSGRLREIPKVGPKKIASIVQGWREGKGPREVMIFTQTYGISAGKAAKIYRTYGPDSVAIIKRDPYRLCRDIWGIGFATADRIALAVGLPKDSPLRARAAIVFTLRTEADEAGHCWTSEPDLLLHAQELVGISVETLAEALKHELDAGRVVKEGDRLYLRDLWVAERRVAAKLKDLLASPPAFAPIDPDRAVAWWERKTGFTLAPAQLRAVRASVGSKVSIVTGGPGVGKTTIIRALVEIFQARTGVHKITVQLGAPTGRAAKRMAESTGAPAQTLHRLLKYNPQTNAFTYNEERPLAGDVFIFDEMSMVDIRLMADLVVALPRRA
ncbi:MAG: helix-hairpin-helix domain-containing protein, partial [bacterium]|nr:helix-hairpin-helix domain-containing protein [bacterium]